MSYATTKTIENAEVKEIRSDMAYKIQTPEGQVYWLTGRCRPVNCKVGDKGKLLYKTTPSSGLWYFEKYK